MTHVSMILKVYKTQMMYENHEICKYLTISHSGYGKKLNMLCTLLTNRTSSKKFRVIKEEMSRFVDKVMFKFKLNLKFYYSSHPL
jgi:ribonuclease HII